MMSQSYYLVFVVRDQKTCSAVDMQIYRHPEKFDFLLIQLIIDVYINTLIVNAILFDYQSI